jgi:hypothetical protein
LSTPRSLVAALILAASCAAMPDVSVPKPANPIALRNADFEAPSAADRPCPAGWFCSMHADPHSFRYFHDEARPLHGKRSACVEPITREPWALVSQEVDAALVRGKRVRFSIAVRTDGVQGDGAGPYIMSRAYSGRVTTEGRRLLQGTHGWVRHAVEIEVPSDALGVEFGVALEGTGRVCMDDAVLEFVGPAKSPV